MATVEAPVDQHEIVPADWPEIIETRVWIGREDDYFFALCDEFDVIGQGPTPRAAFRQMVEMVDGYLHVCAAQGLSYHDVRRPLPLAKRTSFHAQALLSWLLRRVVQDYGVRERATSFVPEAAPAPAHC
jgi:predicted RNase H-like HicB family nuclease